MKEVLEKFGISEFFAYISPGAILLFSFALWGRPNFTSDFWKQEFLVVIIVLIFSYTLGLILASFNHTTQIRYLRLAAVGQRGFLRKVWVDVLRLLYSFPSPRYNTSIVEFNLSISEDLEKISGLVGLSHLANPWEWLMIYRSLIADRVGEKSKTALIEAENLHRRFVFSMGVALAIFLLAVQSFLRLILVVIPFGLQFFHFLEPINRFFESISGWNNTLPSISPLVLLVITLLGLWASLELREVGIRMWELERYLTASLTHSVTASLEPEPQSDRSAKG